MSDTLKTIYNRRAIRSYKNMGLENELIEQVIAAGRMAPSAMNKQPCRYYVLTNKEKIKLLSKEIQEYAVKELEHMHVKDVIKEAFRFLNLSNIVDTILKKDPIFHEAPVVVFITTPKNDTWGALDAGMCAQNMMLAAKALGLDTCPVGFAKMVMNTKNYSILNIPEEEEVLLAVIIGYGDEQPKAHERIANNTFFIS